MRLTGVTKDFGDVHAVRGIDLEIEPGEMVAFLGPNGAGKTTTIDMVLGLSRPTSGDVEVLGMQPRQAIARGLVAAVMQTGGLLKDLTVRETVEYTASLFADTKPVDEVLDSAGITGIADRRVAKCSGGEQQRLRFAMALLSDPALLLLDEPTTGMDVEGRRSFWSAIREDAQQGRSVLFATHYLEEADQYADRIILISNGQIVADGTGSEIKALATRPHRAGHAARRRHRRPRRARRRRQRRGPRRPDLRARQGQRRRRALPAHRDRGPRPRDHRPGPRGRVPQPDRPDRRRTPEPPTATTTTPKEHCDERHPGHRPHAPARCRRWAGST